MKLFAETEGLSVYLDKHFVARLGKCLYFEDEEDSMRINKP